MKTRRKVADTEPFTDVEFHRFFPAEEVADHQVYMGFTNDDDAIAFREWWDSKGSRLFAEYVQESDGDAA